MTSLNELFTPQNFEEQKVIIYGEVPWAVESEVVFIPKHWAELFVALHTSKTWGELSSRIGTEKVHLLYLYSLEGLPEEEVAEGLYPKPNSSEPFSFEELIHSWDERPDPRDVSLVRAWLPEELIVKYAEKMYPAIPYGGSYWFENEHSNTDFVVNELRERGYTCLKDNAMIAEVFDH